ncbi:phosphotransferase [Enemella sp. A6]|uniref:phosphotransferase n=1 Tax=Enemella sp. A6 TaxID=3440152 RepID=UPI003EB8C89F
MSGPFSTTAAADPDGSKLLTSPGIAPLLTAAVEHEGGRLQSWEMQHVDAHPQRSTTATYSAVVEWPYGTREELFGVSARRSGPAGSDGQARIFADGKRSVAVWLYPKDPDLPGLARAAYPEQMARILTEHRVLGGPAGPDQLEMQMIGYRPRRRAVLRATVNQGGRRTTFYVKVLREHLFPVVLQRHQLLLQAGVPAPPVAATTNDFLLILAELPGRPLARAVFDPQPPCTAEQLIGVLDAMPSSIAQLERRPPWSDAVDHYTTMVLQAMPSLEKRLRWMARQIREGLHGIPLGHEPTHGDYHEGQIHVGGGGIVGLLDVDTAGPGRRADDLACLVAHLSTIQRMNPQQAARVQDLLARWVPVFDTRVDPTELRLRAAAVIISLATGPYRGQEPNWEKETLYIVDAAEALIRQVR